MKDWKSSAPIVITNSSEVNTESKGVDMSASPITIRVMTYSIKISSRVKAI